jgi:hypothetical protein
MLNGSLFMKNYKKYMTLEPKLFYQSYQSVTSLHNTLQIVEYFVLVVFLMKTYKESPKQLEQPFKPLSTI